MDFSNFPPEIQDLIFDYTIIDCSRTDLKSFRTCARYFRDRADIYLFRTLHLSASTKSFNRLQNVASKRHLRCHVRELVFHRGTFSGHSMVKFGGPSMYAKAYDDFEGWMIKTVGPTKAFMRISASYAAFNAEVESECFFNRKMTWQDELREACRQFPKLEQLTTVGPSADLDSKYLRRRCGLTYQSSTPGYFAPYEILAPCGRDFRPKALSFDWVNGEDFASMMTSWDMRKGGPEAVMEKFGELLRLRLSFSETVNTLPMEGTWDKFIRACVNLRSLSLDLKQFYTSTRVLSNSSCFSQELVRLVLKQHFSSLQNLTLEHAMMTEEDFITFLDKHQASLSSLKITGWPMPVTERGEPTGSVVRAFHRMGKLPLQRLSSVRLCGTFSSRADGEGWDISYRSTLVTGKLEYLANRLERYLSQRDEVSPFEAAFEDRFKKPRLTAPEIAELDQSPAKLGLYDHSFQYSENFPSDSRILGTLEFVTPRRDYPASPFGADDNDPAWL